MSGRIFHYNSGSDRHLESVEVEEEEEWGEEGDESRLPGMNVSWRRYSLPSERLHSCTTAQTSSAHSDMNSQHNMDSGQRRRNTIQLDSGHSHSNQPPSVWQSFKKAGMELNQDTRKMFRFFGRKLSGSRHGPRQTKVKEVHIVPEGDEGLTWARRMAGSGTSRSSSSSDPST